MPETNLISLMYINLNSVQSNASDPMHVGIQHNFLTYILQQPLTNAFKIICTIYMLQLLEKSTNIKNFFSFCCKQFSQQYYVRLLFDLNATAAISVDSVHQEIIPFTFCSNRVNCYAVQEILWNKKKLSKNTTYRMILPQIVNICRTENVNTVNVKVKFIVCD